MKKCRARALQTVQRKCSREGIPVEFSSVFLRCLRVSLDKLRPLTRNRIPVLAKAITAQAGIGFYHMSVGLLANDWTDALSSFGVEQPQSKIEQLLSWIWNDICEDAWNTRNNINNNIRNHALDDELVTLKDKLLWFQRHHQQVLDYRHQFLVAFTSDDVEQWSRTTRRAKLNILNNAKDWYETECQQRAANQTTMYDWINSYTILRSGKLVHVTAPPAWRESRRGTRMRTRRRSHTANNNNTNNNHSQTLDHFWYDPDDDEFEFDWDPAQTPS